MTAQTELSRRDADINGRTQWPLNDPLAGHHRYCRLRNLSQCGSPQRTPDAGMRQERLHCFVSRHAASTQSQQLDSVLEDLFWPVQGLQRLRVAVQGPANRAAGRHKVSLTFDDTKMRHITEEQDGLDATKGWPEC